MHMLKKSSLFLVLACMVLLISACGAQGGGSAAGNTPVASLTPAQLLQKTTTTMSQLKSVSFTMKSGGNTTMPSFTGSGGNSQTISTTTKANGVLVPPHDTKLQLSTAIPGQTLSFAEVIKGQKVYIQNQKGQWYVMDKSASGASFTNSNVTDYNKLLLLKDVKVTDDGNTTLNGTSVRHLTLTFTKNALNDLMNDTGTLNNLPASQKQQMSKVFQNMTMKNTVLDVWIDNATAYLHRFQLQFDLDMDMSKSVTPIPGNSASSSNIEVTQNTVIDYSKFNDPVTIAAPGNATPASSMQQIF